MSAITKKISGKSNSQRPKVTGHRSGGYTKDIKKPYIFHWPNTYNDPRPIFLNAHTYAGTYGSGGHYYCSIREDDNDVLEKVGKDLWWTTPWDKENIPNMKGREWSGRFGTLKQAIEEMHKILKEWEVWDNPDYEITESYGDDRITSLLRQYGRRIGD